MTNAATTPSTAEPETASRTSWRESALTDGRDFIAKLEELREKDRGRMAQLRRNAGNTLPGRGTAWFYHYLFSPRRQRHAEIHFLVATLFALNRCQTDHGVFLGNFGHSIGLLRQRTDGESVRRRFHIVLDATFDRIYDPLNEVAQWQDGGGEMAFRLRQMVKLLASRDVGVDWAELLIDLCQWSHPDKRVQKRWARSFFGAFSAQDNGAPVHEESPTESQP